MIRDGPLGRIQRLSQSGQKRPENVAEKNADQPEAQEEFALASQEQGGGRAKGRPLFGRRG